MDKLQYRVGIIDDDCTKVTQLISAIKLTCANDDAKLKSTKYADYSLIPVEFELVPNEMDMVNNIIDSHIDAIIIDYKLSSQGTVSYTGVSLAKTLAERLYNFPIFILTSYQDDLFAHELFDSYLVFDFERYIAESLERVELNSKIIEQILKYNTERTDWETELQTLLTRTGESAEIDERILTLDSRLEKTIEGTSSLSEKLKRELTSDKVQSLLEKIDKIIES